MQEMKSSRTNCLMNGRHILTRNKDEAKVEFSLRCTLYFAPPMEITRYYYGVDR